MRIQDDILKTLAPKFKKGDKIIYNDRLQNNDPGVITEDPIYSDISKCFVYRIKLRHSMEIYANEPLIELMTYSSLAAVLEYFDTIERTDRGSRGVQFDYSDAHLCSTDLYCPDGAYCINGYCYAVGTGPLYENII